MKHAWDIEVNIWSSGAGCSKSENIHFAGQASRFKPSKRDMISVLLANLIYAHSGYNSCRRITRCTLERWCEATQKSQNFTSESRGLWLSAVRQTVLLVDDSFDFRISDLSKMHYIIITNPSTSSWGCVMKELVNWWTFCSRTRPQFSSSLKSLDRSADRRRTCF